MKVEPVREIGAHRPLCTRKIRIAAGLATYEAQRQAAKRDKLGVPLTQCAKRADFLVDGEPTCRAHASHSALQHFLDTHP